MKGVKSNFLMITLACCFTTFVLQRRLGLGCTACIQMNLNKWLVSCNYCQAFSLSDSCNVSWHMRSRRRVWARVCVWVFYTNLGSETIVIIHFLCGPTVVHVFASSTMPLASRRPYPYEWLTAETEREQTHEFQADESRASSLSQLR